MDLMTSLMKQEPKFVKKPSFMIIGMKEIYAGDINWKTLKGFWMNFFKKSNLIQNNINPRRNIGLMKIMNEGIFEYICAAGTSNIDFPPASMIGKEIETNVYAMFIHSGQVKDLKKTYDYIFKIWFVKSQYKFKNDSYIIEEYNEGDFNPNSKMSKMYIYVPVSNYYELNPDKSENTST